MVFLGKLCEYIDGLVFSFAASGVEEDEEMNGQPAALRPRKQRRSEVLAVEGDEEALQPQQLVAARDVSLDIVYQEGLLYLFEAL